MSTDAARHAAILEIAKRDLLFETLATQRSSADFREVAVWMVEAALSAAYEAGRAAERNDHTPARCTCPACGRSIEITPIT